MPEQQKSDLFHLSVSKVKTFLTCKAKYRYCYIKHLPKQERDFQIFGKFLHNVLEIFHLSIIEGMNLLDHERMKYSFYEALKEWGHKLSSDQKQESFEILNEYLALRHQEKLSNTVPEVIQVEKDFSLNIDNKILLNGFIDVVKRDSDGIWHVADYKTSKDKKYLKKDLLQLKTYAYVLMYEDPKIKTVRCSYVMLRHKFDLIKKEFEREEIMETAQEFLQYGEMINAEKLYRPTTGPLCRFCDYLGECSEGKKYMIDGNDSFGITDWCE